MTDWHSIAQALALSLRAMPCRCQHAQWAKQPDGSVVRPLVLRCSRCVSLERYDLASQAPAGEKTLAI